MERGEVFGFKVSKENEVDNLWLTFENGMINLNALADSKPGIVGKQLNKEVVTYLDCQTAIEKMGT